MKTILFTVLFLSSFFCRSQSLERITISSGICQTNKINSFVGKTLIFKLSKKTFYIEKNKNNSSFAKELSISSKEKQINFNVYPNPATENIFLNFSEKNKRISVYIFDNNGKHIKTEVVQILNTKKINIAKLNSGLYFLVIRNEKNEILGTSKFFKK